MVFFTCGKESGCGMASKVNIVLDDDVRKELEDLVELGSRSRVINAALRKELAFIRRRRVSERLDHLRAKTKPVSTKDIVRMIRRDRGR
jgi:Arc/MetJ-type ribon-helix-helix transcriptional regulator